MTSWTPAVTLDLATASGPAFEEAKAKFRDWAKVGPADDLILKDGWLTITPEIAEKMLRRNAMNRKIGLAPVKKYAHDMASGEWAETSQGLGFDDKGHLVDGQHRLWACYLSGVPFATYVVTSVKSRKHLFAYYDTGKLRSAGDALYTSGNNGLSSILAGAIQLASLYDNHALHIYKSKGRRLSNPETLQYASEHPNLSAATHMIEANFSRAIQVIGSKPVAAFFAWKAIEAYGENELEDFLLPLGTGANLAEDSIILALRNRLMNAGADDGEKGMSKPHRLALLIKAFLMNVNGEKLPKRGVYLRDNEPFPRLDPPADVANAAE
jgi:hypothetical protein